MSSVEVNALIVTPLAVIFFCTCCYFFLKSLLSPLPPPVFSAYSRAALRVSKGYKVFAWGVMTLTFLTATIISFVEVVTQL